MTATLLSHRPHVGRIPVPYVVDATQDPIDFKVLDPEHVRNCATRRRCGICGRKIRGGPYAFIGPADGRTCFADAWMHPECALLSMRWCPFLSNRTDWRDPEYREAPVLQAYRHGQMRAFVAKDGHAHKDRTHAWHFEAIGPLEPLRES